MISRRVLLATLGGAILAPVTASAQPRIVLLSQAPIGADAGETATIEEGLRTLGYTKGTSISIDYRSADAREDRLPTAAREAVALNPAVIIAIGTKAARALGLTIPPSLLLRADQVIE